MTPGGKIVDLPSDFTDEIIKERGLTPLTLAEATMLRAMSRTERRKWLARSDPSILTSSDLEAIIAAQIKRDRKNARRAAEAKAGAR